MSKLTTALEGEKEEEWLIQRWVAYNAKIISEASFFGDSGTTPQEFYRENKKECRRAWKEYIAYAKKERKLSKKKDGCICEIEAKLPANSYQGTEKTPVRLWHCPLHKNMFADLTSALQEARSNIK